MLPSNCLSLSFSKLFHFRPDFFKTLKIKVSKYNALKRLRGLNLCKAGAPPPPLKYVVLDQPYSQKCYQLFKFFYTDPPPLPTMHINSLPWIHPSRWKKRQIIEKTVATARSENAVMKTTPSKYSIPKMFNFLTDCQQNLTKLSI